MSAIKARKLYFQKYAHPFNHVIKMDLVFCKSIDFEFFNQAKFSFSEKLEVYVA